MSAHTIEEISPVYGLIAEFETPGQLVAAARKTREAGFERFDAFAPYPIHELDEAMNLRDNRVSLFTLIGGLTGCSVGFGLCSWVSALAYPLNIGGRPPISTPMFIPVTFECTILFAGLTCAISMFLMNGLPRPYHPVFHWDRFSTASKSKFFLCIESSDRKYDAHDTLRFLESLNPEEVAEIPK